MKTLILILGLLVVSNCTPNSKKEKTSEKNQDISFDSPFKFEFAPSLQKTEILAIGGSIKLSRNQIISRDPALLELEKINFDLMVTSAFNMALEKLSKNNKDTIVLSLPSQAEQLNLQEILPEVSGYEKVQITYLPQGKNGVKIGEESFTEDELAKTNLSYSQSRQKLFYLKMKRIEERMARYLVTDEAKKMEMDLNTYIEQKISGKNSVSDEEARQYGVENNVPAESINAEMLSKLKTIVEARQRSQKLLQHGASLLGSEKVKLSFQKPVLELKTSVTNLDAPSKGNGEIEITILSNFLCKKCREVSSALEQVTGNMKNKVKTTYVFNFKQEDRPMRMVAEAALCAGSLDKEKFWAFKELAENEEFDGSENKINEAVEFLGLSMEEFRKCFLSRKTKDTVESHNDFVKNLGNLTAPTVLVEGRVFEGDTSNDSFSMALNEALDSPLTSKAGKGFWTWLKNLF